MLKLARQSICNAFTLSMDKFDCPTQTQNLLNTPNQGKSRYTKFTILNNHVDQNL